MGIASVVTSFLLSTFYHVCVSEVHRSYIFSKMTFDTTVFFAIHKLLNLYEEVMIYTIIVVYFLSFTEHSTSQYTKQSNLLTNLIRQ